MSNSNYPYFIDGSQCNVTDLVYVLRSKGILSDSDIDFIIGRKSMATWIEENEE